MFLESAEGHVRLKVTISWISTKRETGKCILRINKDFLSALSRLAGFLLRTNVTSKRMS